MPEADISRAAIGTVSEFGYVLDNHIWSCWNGNYAGTLAAITANNITANTVAGCITIQGEWVGWNTTYTETAEDREERQRNEAELHRQFAEQRATQARLSQEAQQQANELLNELLSDEQRQTWAEQRWFAVRGSASGRLYRIHHGNVDNVYRLSEDETEADLILCAHPPGLPEADCNLAQMLLLVTNEDAFLRIANSHIPTRFESATRASVRNVLGRLAA
jgi:hypothetical protein